MQDFTTFWVGLTVGANLVGIAIAFIFFFLTTTGRLKALSADVARLRTEIDGAARQMRTLAGDHQRFAKNLALLSERVERLAVRSKE